MAANSPTSAELDAMDARSKAIHAPGVPGEVRGEPGGIFAFGPYDPCSEGDAEFHAHARTDVPRLVAEVRSDRKRRGDVLRKAQEIVERCGNPPGTGDKHEWPNGSLSHCVAAGSEDNFYAEPNGALCCKCVEALMVLLVDP